jgi:hypothetical protein
MAGREQMAGRKAGQGHHWIRDDLRLAIALVRDGGVCAYCGRSADEHGVPLTLDHLVACNLGGTNHPSNLTTCCVSCNSRKQDKTMVEWYRVLKAEGRNIRSIAARIAARSRKPIDRAEGRRLAQIRKVTRQAEAA